MMTEYEKLREMLERHEGRRSKPYQCSEGKTTIGIGHNLDDLGLSDKIIDEIFEEDLTNTISDCAILYPNWTELPDDIQIVLANMMFNMGLNRMKKFKKMNRHVEDFNWPRMADEMKNSLWYRQVGNRAIELETIVRSI